MLFFSCIPSNKSVTGKYVAEHDKGIEYVIVKGDNTYVHYYKNDRTEKQQEGRWEFERNGFEIRFVLYDWIEYTCPGEEVSDSTKSIANVICDGNEIDFWDEDEYNFYKVTD